MIDDEKIEKTIKRLFTLNQNKRRKLLLNYFLKFKLQCHKLKFLSTSSNPESYFSNNSLEVYKKKKFQDVPSTKNSSKIIHSNNIATITKFKNSNAYHNQHDENKIDLILIDKINNPSYDKSINKNIQEEISKISMKISNPENFAIIKENKQIHKRLYEV